MVMGIQRDKLLNIIDSDNLNPSLNYWITLLNFFENNITNLDIDDMELICDECERVRVFLNTARTETVTVYRNGQEIKQPYVIPGMNIHKKDISPNVYNHLKQMKDAEDEQKLIEWHNDVDINSVNKPGDTESVSTEKPIPLAAAPI